MNAQSKKDAVQVGASLTAVVALLPWMNDFFIVAYLLGAFAAVRSAARKRKEILSLTDGAQLGFLSGFYGLLAASAIYDVVWHFFQYQLWEIRNVDRLWSIFTGMLHDAVTPSAWIVITFQIIVAAIFAGAIGAPSGILALKIFQRRRA
jgi:hypothetical protein